MGWCLMFGTMTEVTWAQVSARAMLRHWVSISNETLEEAIKEHYVCVVLPEEMSRQQVVKGLPSLQAHSH